MGVAKLAVTVLGLLLGQAPGEVVHTRDRSQSIPINIQEARRAEVRELVLYASADKGRTWSQAAVITPDKSGFVFVAPADGTYWLRSAVVNRNGQQQPEDPGVGRPEWVLVIDTAKPTVRSFRAQRQGDEVVVSWDVQEDHPDWAALRLEYQAKGASVSTPIEAKPGSTGQVKFRPPSAAPLTVRLTARDQAGNVSYAQIEVTGSETVVAGSAPNSPPANAGSTPPPEKTPSLAAQISVPSGGAAGQGTNIPPPVQSGSNNVWTQGKTPTGAMPPPLANGGTATPQGGGSLPPPTRNESALRQVASQGFAPPPSSDPPKSALPPPEKVIADSTAQAPSAGQMPPTGPGGAFGALDSPLGGERRLPPIQYVNQARMVLEYEVSRIGPSGLGSVEVWMTTDNGVTSWKPHARDRSPQETTKGRHQCCVPLPPVEGIYGFTLLLKNRAGFGKAPPSAGDAPAIRVELDVTPPIAKLILPELDRSRPNSLRMLWYAADKNLGKCPVTLEWSERVEGPWQAIGVNLPNTGQYSWQLPSRLPVRVYLRLRVRDLAGNESVAVTAQPLPVDLTEPEGQLINVSATSGR